MDDTKARLAAAEEELEQLRCQIESMKAERDAYKQFYLDELARNSPEISQAELDAAIPTGPWFEEFLKRLESGDPNAIDSWPQHTAPEVQQ